MVDVVELPKARINASMLAQFIDRPVCFVGKLEKVRGIGQESETPWPPGSGWGGRKQIHPTGKMFILSDGEGKNGTIELMEPLDEEISGIVEVIGKVTAKATIMCASYVQFKEDCVRFGWITTMERAGFLPWPQSQKRRVRKSTRRKTQRRTVCVCTCLPHATVPLWRCVNND
ncbi:replication protein A 14 kDa subunit isoform X2 [Onychomys torridus]|uniref:replication protein A 14 kDa subunit isoform X2 n=1 Tax=Onychomys torridus TaxID=38674 RepID=UPI00167F85C3|nr:replication protein A 14 kDa subunit isoform X2 [Onychomys torridus]